MFENIKKRNKIKKDKKNREKENQELVTLIQTRYKESRESKDEFISQWKQNYRAYTGEEFKKTVDKSRSNVISNQIFSTVETVKPIMLTNAPKPIVFPNSTESFNKCMAVQEILEYEFERSKFKSKNLLFLTNMLIYGTGIMGLFWNEGLNNVEPVNISPFNFFIDPLATNIDEADYVMYAVNKGLGELCKMYPEKAEELKKQVKNEVDSDLNYGKEAVGTKNQILCIECYMKDYSTRTYFEEEYNEETGENDTYRVDEMNYPNGRRVLIAGDVLLEDGQNPYKHGKFPFFAQKCYDVPGQFWGMSEVEQLISMNKEINELYDDIVENAHLNSNPVWILDSNCGIAPNTITNRKGLVLRKRPNSTVQRDAPKPLPSFISTVCNDLKYDMQVVSGVFDATRGERPASVSSGVAIQALQDSSQGRIRLKTQKLEETLGEIGSMWIQLIQQYWNTTRTIRVTNVEYFANEISDQIVNNSQQINGKKFYLVDVSKDEVDGDFDISIEAGSTMPTNKSARIETLLRLAQTPAEDGMPIIGRREVLENCSEFIDNLDEVIARYEAIAQQQQQASKEEEILQHDMEMEKMETERQNKKEQMMLQHDMNIEGKQYDNEKEREQKIVDKVIELITSQGQNDGENAQNSKNDTQMEKTSLQNQNTEVQSNQEVNNPDFEKMSIQEFISFVSGLSEEELAELLRTNPTFANLYKNVFDFLEKVESEQPQKEDSQEVNNDKK